MFITLLRKPAHRTELLSDNTQQYWVTLPSNPDTVVIYLVKVSTYYYTGSIVTLSCTQIHTYDQHLRILLYRDAVWCS